MKLPGIDYNTSVQSLGRHNVYGPIRAATASARAAEARANVEVGRIASGNRIAAMRSDEFRKQQWLISKESEANLAKAKAIGDVIGLVVDAHSKAESERAIREYNQRMLVGVERITSEKYTAVEQPDGSVRYVSRHGEIEGEFAELAKDSRDAVNAGMLNPFAKKAFDEYASKAEAQGRGEMYLKAVDWQKDDAAATTAGEIKGAIASGDFKGARNLLEFGVAYGLIDDPFAESDKIDSAELLHNYNTTLENLNDISNVDDIDTLVEGLDQPGVLTKLGPKTIESLKAAALGKKQLLIMEHNDSFGTVSEKVAAYEDFLTKKDEYGLSAEEHSAIAGALRGRINDFQAFQKIKGDASSAAVALTEREQYFATTSVYPATRVDKEVVDGLYDKAAKAEMEASGSHPVQAIRATGKTKMYLPKKAITDLHNMIDDADVASSMSGIMLYEELRANPKLAEQLKESLDKESARKAKYVLSMYDDGKPMANAISDYHKMYTENVDVDKASAMWKELNKDSKGVKAVADLIEEELGFDPEDLGIDAAYDLNKFVEDSFELMYNGDSRTTAKAAVKDAVATFQNRWTNTGNGFEEMPPHIVLPVEQRQFIKPEIEHVAKLHNIDPADIQLRYNKSNKKSDEWFMMKDGAFLLKDGKKIAINFDPSDLSSPFGRSVAQQKQDAAKEEAKQRGMNLANQADMMIEREGPFGFDLDPSEGIYRDASFKEMRDVVITDALDLLDWIKAQASKTSPEYRQRMTKFYNGMWDKRVAALSAAGVPYDETDLRIGMAAEGWRNYDLYPETGKP